MKNERALEMSGIGGETADGELLGERVRDYIAWLAGGCTGCFRRGASCRTCPAAPAAGLLRDLSSAGEVIIRVPRGSVRRKASLPAIRAAIEARLHSLGQCGAPELYEAGRAAGATESQIEYQLALMVRSGAAALSGGGRGVRYTYKEGKVI